MLLLLLLLTVLSLLLLLLDIGLFLFCKLLLLGDRCEEVVRFEVLRIILANSLFFHLLVFLYTH